MFKHEAGHRVEIIPQRLLTLILSRLFLLACRPPAIEEKGDKRQAERNYQQLDPIPQVVTRDACPRLRRDSRR